MFSGNMVDLRLHNLTNDLCINVDTPSDRTLNEIGQFLKQHLGA